MGDAGHIGPQADEGMGIRITRKVSYAFFIRPSIHITAPCWMNDPCAPGYDSNTGLYHLFYQCNPHGCDWGNMSWAHVTSKDLLSWRVQPIQPALRPDEEYDKEGVFTGCWAPLAHDKQLSVFYSSINKLPFHWSTPPYPRGAAGLAVATSNDGGRTWTKSANNPILAEEPEGVEATGFRDPYLAKWTALDEVRGKRSLYGIICGGFQSSGPTAFLYAVQAEDLTKWSYLGPLVDIPGSFHPSKKWTGNYGFNWECTNFMTLESGMTSRQFLILGAEGNVEREHVHKYVLPPTLPPRTVRCQLWMSGDLVKRGDNIKFQYKYGGILDHGPYYAANSFVDPPSGRRIVWGWIPEEDCTLDYVWRKGWNGCQALPRELFLLVIPNVTKALRSPLPEISCMELQQQPDGSTTLYTLGIRPISELNRLRDNCLRFHIYKQLSLPQSTSTQHRLASTSSPTWELECTVSVKSGCEAIGLHIRHSDDFSVRTTITFSLSEEEIIVTRSDSTSETDFNKCDEQGPFTLFTTKDAKGTENLEKLQLRIISDADVLEVFANDRFALATMVYTGAKPSNNGVTAFATGEAGSAFFEEIRIWDGLNGMKSLMVEEGDAIAEKAEEISSARL